MEAATVPEQPDQFFQTGRQSALQLAMTGKIRIAGNMQIGVALSKVLA